MSLHFNRVFRLLFLTLLVGCACAQAPVAQAVGEPGSTPLSGTVPEVLTSAHVASVSFAEIVNGKLTTAAAFGEQSAGVPATASTLYNIASMTKPISAEVILRLASQRKLSLDEPMYLYWTDPDIAGDERRKLLTPRLALSHQTGFFKLEK